MAENVWMLEEVGLTNFDLGGSIIRGVIFLMIGPGFGLGQRNWWIKICWGWIWFWVSCNNNGIRLVCIE